MKREIKRNQQHILIKMKYIYGVDETNKCPVMGTLPVCIMKIKKGLFNKREVRSLPIRDSKLTTRRQREVVFNNMNCMVDYSIRRIYPYHMADDNLVNLQVKEIIQGLKILKYQDGERVYIDLFDSSKKKLIQRFKKYGFNTDFSKWVIEHKADLKYKVVGLASIFSKISTDSETAMIRKDYDAGSGNPADIQTLKFIIKNYDNLPWFVRRSWLTVRRLKNPEFRGKIFKRILELEREGERVTKEMYKNV